jgi:hypothetical protein
MQADVNIYTELSLYHEFIPWDKSRVCTRCIWRSEQWDAADLMIVMMARGLASKSVLLALPLGAQYGLRSETARMVEIEWGAKIRRL